jgi:hypothetical protein
VKIVNVSVSISQNRHRSQIGSETALTDGYNGLVVWQLAALQKADHSSKRNVLCSSYMVLCVFHWRSHIDQYDVLAGLKSPLEILWHYVMNGHSPTQPLEWGQHTIHMLSRIEHQTIAVGPIKGSASI